MENTQADDTKESSLKDRKDLHIARRLFHLTMGVSCGLIYIYLLTHQQAVHILGISTCILYLLEQVRINYPEFKSIFTTASSYLLRAEEQLKESASIPFLVGILLTVLSFPKEIAIIAIFTLAISDPLSAVIGIQFGKTKIKEHRSLEGCSAFFFSSLIIQLIGLSAFLEVSFLKIILISFLSSMIVTLFDLLALKIDDNLTIPLVSASSLWILINWL